MSIIMPALLGDVGWLVNKFVIYHCRFRLLITLLRLFHQIIRWVWNIRTFCIFSHGVHMRVLVNGVKFFTSVYSLNAVQSICGFSKFNPISITFIVFLKKCVILCFITTICNEWGKSHVRTSRWNFNISSAITSNRFYFQN